MYSKAFCTYCIYTKICGQISDRRRCLAHAFRHATHTIDLSKDYECIRGLRGIQEWKKERKCSSSRFQISHAAPVQGSTSVFHVRFWRWPTNQMLMLYPRTWRLYLQIERSALKGCLPICPTGVDREGEVPATAVPKIVSARRAPPPQHFFGSVASA